MNKCVVPSIVLLIIGAAGGYYGAQYLHRPRSTVQQCTLWRTMDRLWTDHVFWTRQFIVSSAAGLSDVQVAAQRLLKNQDDIGNALVPYYGNEAGARLTQLLREHITIAADLVKAVIAKNDAKTQELDAQWHTNAHDIATFLAGANPNWKKDDLVSMLNEHLALTTKELTYRLASNWIEDIANFDAIAQQARMMGQAIADGIIQQMPSKF